MDAAGAPLHVVVLPWLAFGHLLPFLQLSKSLARRGHRVSFVSTPRNLQRLPRVPPTLSHLITIVELPFPAGIPLTPGAEATTDIHPADNGHLKAAFDALEAPFAAFLDSVTPTPDWVVHDFTAQWMPRVAVPRRLPCAFFSGFPPSAMAFYGPPSELFDNVSGTSRRWKKPEDFTVPPPWTAPVRHSSTVAYRLHEARAFFLAAFGKNASAFYDAQRISLTLEAVQVVVMRSCLEVDGDWLLLLGELYNKPVIPAGFLPPPAVQEGTGKTITTNSPAGADVLEWLDRQAPSSVLYAALGSEAVLSVDLFHELALGLDLSQLPFLWALRRPAGLPPDVELVPEGFEARTAGRGVVAKGWIPQPEVLAHPAVGGFLTHCGWSSLVEGLRHGRPLVMLPVFVDQGLNARLMEARGVGREVPRGEDDGVFTREGVAETARLVVVDDAGKGVRAAARRAGEVFGDQRLQETYEDELAQYLVDHRRYGPEEPAVSHNK